MSEKQEGMGFFGHIIIGLLGLLATHLEIGRFLGTIKPVSGSVFHGVKIEGWVFEIVGICFIIYFAFLVVVFSFWLFEKWQKSVPAILFVYLLISVPNLKDWHAYNYHTPDWAKAWQGDELQIESNKNIEKFILGELKESKKWIATISNENKEAQVIFLVKQMSLATKRDTGFYNFSIQRSFIKENEYGDSLLLAKLNELITEAHLTKEKQSILLVSKGLSLIDIGDNSLYGCYPTASVTCEYSDEKINASVMKTQNGGCNCIKSSSTDKNGLSLEAVDCSVNSNKLCRAGGYEKYSFSLDGVRFELQKSFIND